MKKELFVNGTRFKDLKGTYKVKLIVTILLVLYCICLAVINLIFSPSLLIKFFSLIVLVGVSLGIKIEK